ncbi:MAG: FIG00458394: hypothetical protein [uncultured Paraburkholderia sp.]|nr:MAG: FIG00458394: hypothetical protein [uncultured Paraburkholderia sp.]CAH2935990.1 MAG: FIG00458394: hypothetical protein [uncultured Paraburkholderia sp.]
MNFDWLTKLLAVLFVIACLYDARYDEYGTLTLTAAAMSLAVMAFIYMFAQLLIGHDIAALLANRHFTLSSFLL